MLVAHYPRDNLISSAIEKRMLPALSLSLFRAAPGAAARRFDPNAVAGRKLHVRFSRKFRALAALAHQVVHAGRAVAAARESPWSRDSPFGEQTRIRFDQRLDFTD